ncbi:MAG: hypothetical protein JG762_1149 [Deferribacteraceae bacterium]|jgi:hypothetical protein|nr:hypothetical protein [Deferribacteraceae bacterium]
MHILFKQNNTFFCVDEKYVEMFVLSKNFYPFAMTPKFISGFENIKGEIYPVIDLHGFISNSNHEEKEYLIKLTQPLSILLYSTIRPNIIEILDTVQKTKVDSDLKTICDFNFRIENNIIYNLNMGKLENILKDYQKNIYIGDSYDKESF